MLRFQRWFAIGLLLGMAWQAQVAMALEPSSPLLAFATDEGMQRLLRSQAKADFAPLANQFEPQSNGAFCGPATASIVLNALHPADDVVPRDGSRLRAEDNRYLRPGSTLALPRYTQESVVARGQKTRAQVFGEPHLLDGKSVRDGGYQLRQLAEMLQAHHARTRLVIADALVDDATIRHDFISNLQNAGDFVIVNYFRPTVGQGGGGHISPLAAYDAESDSVLVLDVNPSFYGWVWMPLTTLIKGMRTKDVAENRGYLLVGQ